LRLYKTTVRVVTGLDAESPKHPAASQFIARLMQVAGTESVAAFAAMTGQPERYVYRWKAGEAAPNFINTIEMLERLGLLRWDHQQLTEAEAARRTRLLREAEEALERLRAAME
jgi:hypothetical protein